MMQKIKTASFHLILGFFLTGVNCFLKSNFLQGFFENDLLTILIALLGLNIATLGIVFSKLEEISENVKKNKGIEISFEKTQREAFLSIKEQMWMIIITVCFSIISSSPYSQRYELIWYVSQGILGTVFVWALFVLYDTSSAVFKVLNFRNKD